MPFYGYQHCNYKAVLRRTMSERVLPCPECGAEMRPLINREHCPNTIFSSVSNQLYNNGQGYWDPGLGKWVENRQQHERFMKELGVTEYTGTEDEFMSSMEAEQPEPDIGIETVKDVWEQEEAAFNNGKRAQVKEIPKIPQDINMIGGDGV